MATARTLAIGTLLRRMRASLARVKWAQSGQALADGAANTIGTVLVYSLVVLIVFMWYRNTKKQDLNARGEDTSHHSILEGAIAFSKPAAALRTASQSFGQSPTTNSFVDPQHTWI